MRSNVSPPQRLERGGYSEPLAARERGSTSGTLGTLRGHEGTPSTLRTLLGCGGTPSTPSALRAHQFEPIMSGVRPARYLSESRRRCGGTGGARMSPFADVGWGVGRNGSSSVRACVSACRRVCVCVCQFACACARVCVVCVLRGLLYYSRKYYHYAHAAEPPAREPARADPRLELRRRPSAYRVLTGYSGGTHRVRRGNSSMGQPLHERRVPRADLHTG
jgi:hypothetical protein